ncbi:MAG TPA: OsmC family peroxiredoxin [Acidimicrobiia bacterium]|nr:OsmC family peroxiredoxin [Acidimicrobiia bacterium]
MALQSTGRTHWEGDLFNGSGTTSFDTGAAEPLAVHWNARAEEHGGVTSPEELIAAAHSACYSMAFSNALAKNETPPTSLDVTATATFVPGTGITTMELDVLGNVDGISEEKFLELAEAAKEGCPVSKALAGNVEISLTARLG